MLRQTFSAEDVIIPIHYYAILVELLSEQGVAQDILLTGTQIAASALKNHQAAISFRQLKTLIHNAQSHSTHPTLGLLLGQQIKVSSHGLIGYAAMTAQTLGDAMSIAAKYVNLVTPLAKVTYHSDESHGFLEAEESIPLGDIKQFCLESWACCLYTMTAQMLGQAITDFEIELSFPQPIYVDQYMTFFGKIPRFGCNYNRVSIPKSFLEIPLPLADRSSHQLAIEQCEAQMDMFYGPQSLVDKIKQIITTAPDCHLTMEETADIFCVTTRTLRRHLKSFDVNYQNILVEVKKERACQLIDENKHSIELIAERVGYQDISNFNRAFKKWTGTTPAKFRQREA